MLAQKSVQPREARPSDGASKQTAHSHHAPGSRLHNRFHSYAIFCRGALSRLLPNEWIERAPSRGAILRNYFCEMRVKRVPGDKRWTLFGKRWQHLSETLVEYSVNYISYLSPLYLLQIVAYLFSRIGHYWKRAEAPTLSGTFPRLMLPYTINDRFFTPVTAIFFTRSKRFHVPICLKEWPRCMD